MAPNLTKRKRLYVNSGLTTRRIARFSGISAPLVCALLNGQKDKRPRPKTVRAKKRIAQLLGVSHEIMWGPGSLEPESGK